MSGRRIKTLTIICVIILGILAASGYMTFLKTEEPGWHENASGEKYYVNEDGRPAKGYCIIGDGAYYFKRGGKPADKGWIEDRYFATGGGALQTGWKYLDGKVYYFYQKEDDGKPLGEKATNYCTAGKIEIPEKGYIDGKRGEALAYGIDVLNRHGWDLREAYKYSSSLGFVEGGDETYGMSISNCAIQGFKYGEGNCLAWSGTLCVMAKLLGKDCRMVWGKVRWNGGDYSHGWLESWEEDGIHVYDPRKNQGDGFAGFDVRYGQKGTYRYDESDKTYLKW